MSTYKIINDDCFNAMRSMPENSVDAIVTDPPYGLEFMGKDWDKGVPSVEIWREAYRVLKPGGHILAFAGTRTQHRMCCAIEDAGFDIRDMLAWIYGSGFTKSHDVAKAIDKQLNATPEIVGRRENDRAFSETTSGLNDKGGFRYKPDYFVTRPTSEEGRRWEGWGTALKPALEPITLARKPFKGPVAANVQEWGTGALNIDANRVSTNEHIQTNGKSGSSGVYGEFGGMTPQQSEGQKLGRWPANLIHDGSDEVLDIFPRSKSSKPKKAQETGDISGANNGMKLGFGEIRRSGFEDEGSAARFFYCAKASKHDREEGLGGFVGAELGPKGNGLGRVCETCGVAQLKADDCVCEVKSWVNPPRKNSHPTVKPTSLMRHLCRLITPPGGLILDPFCGSGSTGKAAILEGFDFVGIDLSEEYCLIATARCDAVAVDPVFRLFDQDDLEA